MSAVDVGSSLALRDFRCPQNPYLRGKALQALLLPETAARPLLQQDVTHPPRNWEQEKKLPLTMYGPKIRPGGNEIGHDGKDGGFSIRKNLNFPRRCEKASNHGSGYNISF